jgi:hypothetical protein
MAAPYYDRVPAIRAKHKALGFTGPTEQDRERDQVIGFLLEELESRDFALRSLSRAERRWRKSALRSSQYGAVGWLLACGLGACLSWHVTGWGVTVAVGSAFLVGTLGVALVYRIRRRDERMAETDRG